MAVGLTLASFALASAAGADAAAERAEAERLATTLFYEGVPYEEGVQITAAGSARLVELLEQPEEARFHGRILLLLGMAAQPGAYEAIAAFANAVPHGELDSAGFRACRLLPLAMGHLARSDSRALDWLTARAQSAPADPGFARGAMNGQRMGRMMRENAVRGLGLSGRAEALAVVRQLRSEAETAASAHPGLSRVASEAEARANAVRSLGTAEAHRGAFE